MVVSPQPRRSIAAHVAVALTFVVFAAASPTVAAQTAPPTGPPASQTIQLMPGPNLVSLHVLPQNASLAALFDGFVPDILAVIDARGRVFAPAYGAGVLTQWAWDESYVVHARDTLSVVVHGASILASAPLRLRAGWNSVPYLGAEAAPVEAALASLAPHLRTVEDGAGRVFPPVSGRPTLTTLVPGSGYRVNLAQAATLTFSPPPPPTGADTTVTTMAEALALTVVVPGQTIDVLGYHTAGDGGGGLFRVSNQGETPDGGVVFVPDVALTARTTVRVANNNDFFDLGLPAGSVVPARDWSAVPVGTATPHTIRAWVHLHGHIYASSTRLLPPFQSTGRVILYNNLTQPLGFSEADVTYRASTSPLRLVRQGVAGVSDGAGSAQSRVLNARWFGARPEHEAASPADVVPGSDFDAQPALAWASNLADRLNDPARGGAAGTITEIHLPGARPGGTVYRYLGPVELGDGVTLSGDGGTETVAATTAVSGPGVSAQFVEAGYAAGTPHVWATYEAGPQAGQPMTSFSHSGDEVTFTYHPTRIRDAHTSLKLFDAQIHLFARMGVPQTNADWLPPDVDFLVGRRFTSFTARHSPRANGQIDTETGGGLYLAPDVRSVGFRDLVLDGNYDGNREIWEQSLFGLPGGNSQQILDDFFRNTPAWGGICISGHNGKRVPAGQRVELRGVAVLGFGANGLLGQPNNTWDGASVLVGNSLWNHTLYAANGTFRDLTFTGFAWGHAAFISNEIENIVYERGVPAPYRPGGLNLVRGQDAFTSADTQGAPQVTRSDGSHIPTGLRANGLFVDGRSSDMVEISSGAGPDNRIAGAVMIPNPAGQNLGLFHESHNGYYRGLWAGNAFERFLSFRAPYAGGNTGFTPRGPFQGLVARTMLDVQLVADAPGGGGLYGSPISVPVSWYAFARPAAAGPAAGTNPWNEQLVQTYRHVDVGARTYSAISVTNRLARLPNGAFQADPAAPSFDVRSAGTRLFLDDVHVRNTSNSVLVGPDNSFSTAGIERYAEVFIQGSSFNLFDYDMNASGLLRRSAYFRDVTFRGASDDREPDRLYTSEDAGTVTASGGESVVEVPTDLFYRPIEAWTEGGEAFSGGRLAFAGSAASAVASSEWVERPNTRFSGDWRGPILRVTFSRPLAAGETLAWEAAVRPWPAGVTLPAE